MAQPELLPELHALPEPELLLLAEAEAEGAPLGSAALLEDTLVVQEALPL